MTTKRKPEADFTELHYWPAWQALSSAFPRALCGRYLRTRKIGRNLVYDASALASKCTCQQCCALLAADTVS